MAPTIFVSERFESLRRLVVDAVAAAPNSHPSSTWLAQLQAAKTDLARLAAVPPPNPSEKYEVESGFVTLNGTRTQLQPEVVQQTLQLSQYLNVSEHFAASLLQAGRAERARWGRPALKTATLLFHREKAAVLSTLRTLLEVLLGEVNASTEPSSLSSSVESLIRSLLDDEVSSLLPGKTTRLVPSLLTLLDSVEGETQKLNTLANSALGSPYYSEEMIDETLESLAVEAQGAGHVLVLLALTGQLRPRDMSTLLKWLQNLTPAQFGTHAIYVLTATLALLGSSTAWTNSEEEERITTMVSTSTQWKTPPVGSVLALQWVLALVQRVPTVGVTVIERTARVNRLQAIATEAIQSGVFAFLNMDVLTLRNAQIKDYVWQNDVDADSPQGPFDAEFQAYLLGQIESLVSGVTEVMLPLVKRIHRDEQNALSTTARTHTSAAAEFTLEPQLNATQQLFDLVAKLVSDRPEAALPLWTDSSGRPTRFLLWAIDLRDSQTQLSLLGMLSAMSSGPLSAMQAHNLLANAEPDGSRLLTWSSLFAWVRYYLETYLHADMFQEMDPSEVNQLVSFLHLLRNVVYYSKVARMALYERAELDAIGNLFRLALLHVHSDLKAALFDVLAAFARRDNSSADQIAQEIWALLSSSKILEDNSKVFGRSSGAIYHLDHIESQRQSYPATAALVRLFTAIVPYFSEGTDAYVNFVLHDVFLKVPTRAYAAPADQWQVILASLDFFDRCLSTFTLDPELASLGLSAHAELQPGFLLLKDILTGEALAKELFALLQMGHETLRGAPLRTHAIKMCMLCLKRVFEVQDAFLQDLVPLLADDADQIDRLGVVANYAPLDQHLLFAHETVVEITLYINASSVSVAMLSIQLLGYIASSPSFAASDRFSLASGKRNLNRLIGLLEVVGETDRVRAGYIDRLLNPPDGDVGEADDGAVLLPSATTNTSAPARAQSIRMTILHFFIDHLRLRPPSIVHLLLGYDVSTPAVATEAPPLLPDPQTLSAPPTVLSTILSLINPEDGSLSTLLAQNPDLTERCFQLLLGLCSEPYASNATLAYLRTYEHSLVQHLPTIPFDPIEYEYGSGQVLRPRQPPVRTTVNAIVANLRIKASILEIIALQVHALTTAGQLTSVVPLVEALVGPSRTTTEGNIELIDLLSSLDFTWIDDRDGLRAQMTLLSQLNDDMARDGPLFDLDKARTTIILARKELKTDSGLSDQTSRDTFDADAAHWIQWMVAQNAHTSVEQARNVALKNWRHATGMIISQCKLLLRTEDRVSIPFQILEVLLPLLSRMQLEGVGDTSATETVSGAILEVIAGLRLISREQNDLLLRSDRILTQLRAIVNCILLPGFTSLARGNLYSALINLLQFGQQQDSGPEEASSDGQDGISLASAPSLAYSAFSLAQAGPGLMSRVRLTLIEKADPLVVCLAKDTLDAPDVWKSVSYTLLDKLVELEGGRSVRVLDILIKGSYLRTMVSALRDSDLALQDCLKPDPATLNASYVYQAQMNFFVRLATSRKGVEALLDLGVINILAQADFIAASPESNSDFHHTMEGFLPAARERYAELLTPALELVTCLFSGSPIANNSVSTLLANQGESFTEVFHSLLGSSGSSSIHQVQQANLLVILLTLRAAKLHIPLPVHAPNYHHQVLALAAGFLTKQGWSNRITPSNETEREQSTQLVTRTGPTVFDRRVWVAVQRLQRSLLGYLEIVCRPSGTTGGLTSSDAPEDGITTTTIKPVLTASIVTHPFFSTVPPQRTVYPSLGTAVQALQEALETFSVRVHQLDQLGTLAANPTLVRWDDLEKLVLGVEGTLCPNEVQQAANHPALALRLVHQRTRTLRTSIASSLSTIELLLVLLYRHIDFYVHLDPTAQRLDPVAAPNGGDTSFRRLHPSSTTHLAVGGGGGGGGDGDGALDRTRLVRFGLDTVSNLMDRTMEIALDPSQVPRAQERCTFIEMVLRKIEDSLQSSAGDDVETE